MLIELCGSVYGGSALSFRSLPCSLTRSSADSFVRPGSIAHRWQQVSSNIVSGRNRQAFAVHFLDFRNNHLSTERFAKIFGGPDLFFRQPNAVVIRVAWTQWKGLVKHFLDHKNMSFGNGRERLTDQGARVSYRSLLVLSIHAYPCTIKRQLLISWFSWHFVDMHASPFWTWMYLDVHGYRWQTLNFRFCQSSQSDKLIKSW